MERIRWTIVLIKSKSMPPVFYSCPRDIESYNAVEPAEHLKEEMGWKLVHGDVFRAPAHPLWFSVLIGTGVQVSAMAGATMVIALLGLLSPANRGSFVTTLLLWFVFMGIPGGYTSARLYKLFHGTAWKQATLSTALCYPSLLFAIFFITNGMLWHQGSSQAVPFGTLFALLVLWFGISVPLVFVGAYFGYKAETLDTSVRTNQIPRHLPTATRQHPVRTVSVWLLIGIFPFSVVWIELFFIMSALWMHQIYYVFGFLFIVLAMMLITTAECTIVLTYVTLCREDYRWWWPSFLSAGSSALFLLAYAAFYFVAKLDITSVVSSLLYAGYMSMIALTVFFLTGTCGFVASFCFVQKIYGSIKID